MTDKEIIKGLECCSKSDTEDNHCDSCPYEKEKYCASKISKDSLDLINRLKDYTIHNLLADKFNLEEQLQDITEKFNCQQTVYEDLSNIIDEKNTEIERLKRININNCRSWQSEYNRLRSEAVKEFAKDLKEFMHNKFKKIDEYEFEYVTEEDIDIILKEKAGESNDRK